jgi:hypothetical protein
MGWKTKDKSKKVKEENKWEIGMERKCLSQKRLKKWDEKPK